MAKKISGSVGKGGKNTSVDTSGQVVSTLSVSDTDGSPAPSDILTFSAPASSATESVGIVYPIGDEFVYDPIEFGPIESIDFRLDVLPSTIDGAARIDITLAIIQSETFIASPTADTPSVDDTELDWTTLSQTWLRAEDFSAVDGGPEHPDFGRPIQFGYTFLGEYSTTALSVELGIDNMEATINTVPEPSSVMLLVSMGAVLLWRRWWSSEDETQR